VQQTEATSPERSVTLTISEADYVRAGQLAHVDGYRKPRAWLSLIAGAIFAIAAITGLAHRHSLLGAFVPAILLLGGPLVKYFHSVPSAYRKNYARSAALRQPISYLWSPEEFEFSGGGRDGRQAWTGMDRTVENQDSILIFLKPGLMHIVPKRFLTRDQAEDLMRCTAAVGRT